MPKKQPPSGHYQFPCDLQILPGLFGLRRRNLVMIPVVSIVFLLSMLSIASGQNNANRSRRIPDQWEQSDFRPPRNIGSPRSTQSGGRRNPGGNCINPALPPPTALVPPSGFGITQEPYPQISWYMPPNLAEAVEFILFNENDEEIYAVQYALNPGNSTLARSAFSQPQLSSTQGEPAPAPVGSVPAEKGQVMSLQIPHQVGIQPLTVGSIYRWEVSLICDINNRTRDLHTTGYVQRLLSNPDLQAQIQQANPPEKVFIYANARLWYETLASVISLQPDRQPSQTSQTNGTASPVLTPLNPEVGARIEEENTEAIWAALLNSVGLEQIAQQTISLRASSADQ
ncbi:MAG: DUF928 domain-containing protein [Coleofasciculaceae cyanobacterium SM2_1_6]|nr:DUF928 domain-containing protein [Coleofasciculaceae cyanobacterium SM2_1_6]